MPGAQVPSLSDPLVAVIEGKAIELLARPSVQGAGGLGVVTLRINPAKHPYREVDEFMHGRGSHTIETKSVRMTSAAMERSPQRMRDGSLQLRFRGNVERKAAAAKAAKRSQRERGQASDGQQQLGEAG